MVADVEIVVRNIVEGLEEVEKLDTTFRDLEKTVEGVATESKGLSAQQIRLRKAHAELLARVRAAEKGFENLTAAEIAAIKGSKEYAEATSQATKLSESFQRGLTGITKGMLGVATAYAVGRAIFNFTKDSLEAAKAAGVATKEFNELEDATARLKAEFGEAIIGEGGGLTVLADIANSVADSLEAANLSAQQLALVGLHRERRTVTGDVPVTGLEATTEVFVDAEGNIVAASNALESYNENAERNASLVREMDLETRQYVNTIGLVIDEQAVWEMQQDRLNQELNELRGLMTPLSGDIEDFQESIADLREEEAELAAEFGLLEFLTPEQQTQIGLLKSSLTGVWLEYQKVLDTIEDEDLGAGKLEKAEEIAEEFRFDIGLLEAQIIALGGVPYVTQEQEDEARERLAGIGEEIDEVTAAWERQTSMMLFGLAEQRLALGGFTEEEVAALGDLAAGLGLIDPAQVAVLDAIADVASEMEKTGDISQFTEDMGEIVDILSDPDIDPDAIPDALKGIGETGEEITFVKDEMQTLLEELQEFHGSFFEATVHTNYTFSGTPPPGTEGAGTGTDEDVPEGGAHGGFVTAGAPITVGELGKEVFVPSQSGNIIPNNQLDGGRRRNRRGGRNSGVNIGTISVQGTTLEEFLEDL